MEKDKIPSCGKIWSELIKDKANEDDEHDIADLIGFSGDDRKTRLFVKCLGEVSTRNFLVTLRPDDPIETSNTAPRNLSVILIPYTDTITVRRSDLFYTLETATRSYEVHQCHLCKTGLKVSCANGAQTDSV